jgi:hypothetical protein
VEREDLKETRAFEGRRKTFDDYITALTPTCCCCSNNPLESNDEAAVKIIKINTSL